MFAMVIEDLSQYQLFAMPLQGIAFSAWRNAVFWVYVVAAIMFWGGVIGLAYSIIYHRSVVKGPKAWLSGCGEGILDLFRLFTGWRRVYAIAKLSFLEAIRRRVLYVFILFFLPFLFAGWYLDKSPDGQLLFLVAFVNTAITYILLPLIVFLVGLSLPNDIQSRTIQTVVTKPVRRLEIVVGRALGFIGIFTLVLAVMGGVSLLYLWGQTAPEVRAKKWKAQVPIFANRTPIAAEKALMGDVAESGRWVVPLAFFKKGQWDFQGTNVGKEWYSYRSHVEGGTNDAAVWYFQFDPDQVAVVDDPQLGRCVRVQMTFDIFKTTKGDPTRDEGIGEKTEQSGVMAHVEFIDRGAENQQNPPKVARVVRAMHHRATEVLVPTHYVMTGVEDAVNVFKNGKVEVVVKCLSRSQYIGMAAPDLYLMARESSFELNFLKGLVSVWLKCVLLICVAVAASTVLKGFTTVLLTITVYLLGIYYMFMLAVAFKQIKGGGPLESAIRIATQSNQVSPLESNIFVDIVLWIDARLLDLLQQLRWVIPNLTGLETVQYVAAGVDIPLALVVRNVGIVIGYVIPVLIIGYFFFRNRELAA